MLFSFILSVFIKAMLYMGSAPSVMAVIFISLSISIWIFAAATLATVFGYGYYNLTFVQFQGRYLYPALIPVGALLVLGAWGWTLLLRRWLKGEVWDKALAWLPLVAVAWMPLLAIWALFRYVVPNLG